MSRGGATALVVLASVLLVGATVTGYARLAFFNSGQVADRASAALAQPAVRTAIGERVTDEIVLRNDADLIAERTVRSSCRGATRCWATTGEGGFADGVGVAAAPL